MFFCLILGATVPHFSLEVKSYIYESDWPFFSRFSGKPFPEEYVKKAREQVEEFCNILQQEGVKVRRPDLMDFAEVTQKKKKEIILKKTLTQNQELHQL